MVPPRAFACRHRVARTNFQGAPPRGPMAPHYTRKYNSFMRIAALIQAHHRPDLLAHLINRLSSDLWQVYVHLDKKANSLDFAHLTMRVRSFESIHRVYWASFSHVLATLHLMRRALE